MVTQPCDLDPGTQISVTLFRDVTNTSELKQLSRDGRISAALVNPGKVVSVYHVMSAASRAVYSSATQRAVTKTRHAELIYSMSASKNISDAFRKFGVSDNMSDVLVVELHAPGESSMPEITSLVKGREAKMEELSDITNIEDIKKLYKIKEPELEIGTLEEAVVGRMASKDFINY